MSVSVVKQTESFLWQYIWVLGSEVGYWVSRSQLHCSSGSEVRRGGFTGQCTGPDTLPVGAKFGREVIRFPHCVHMILSQLLERCPLSYRHTLNESRHTLRSSSAFRICEVKEYLQQSSSILDLSVSWLDWIFGPGATEHGSFLFLPPLSRNSPATAPGGRKRLLTRHVSRTGCDTRAQGVPGPGKRWSSAPHQGAHPRWWVT